MSRTITTKKYDIKWNVHLVNNIKENPSDFIYCFQGDSTRDFNIRVHKVTFQYPVNEDGVTIFSKDILKAEYYLLYTLLYYKKSEEHDPYNNNWYKNYTSIAEIASDYCDAMVFKSLKEVEDYINNRTNELAYMLSYIADSTEEAQLAASRTRIIDVAKQEQRYNGYDDFELKKDTTLEDIAWYFNEFATSIGILSMQIKNRKLHLHLDREARVTFEFKGHRGYLEHWRDYDKAGTISTITTHRAFDAVKWLLYKANHNLPLDDTL